MMSVKLDPKLVWRLGELAEVRGVSTSEVVAELLAGVAAPAVVGQLTAEGDQTRAEVARLHGLGLTDDEIAERVGRVREHVARVRRRLGLKMNKEEVAA